MNRRDPWRFRWDHRNRAHRSAVKLANRALATIPFEPKYRITGRLRDRRLPYSLVRPSDVVVQVGAPADTLLSGRSRGMHLALRSTSGIAIIVEPDPASAHEFEVRATALGLNHVRVVNAGAWSSASTMTLLVDRTHPATNFLDGRVDYDDNRRQDFAEIEVPVKTLDEIVEQTIGRSGPVRIVSITTNNSEHEILRGMPTVLARGVDYLCLAHTSGGYDDLAAQLGFAYLGSDDRGFTYKNLAL